MDMTSNDIGPDYAAVRAILGHTPFEVRTPSPPKHTHPLPLPF